MTHGVLSLQCGDEPFQHALHPILLVRTLGDAGEKQGVLAPVGRELSKRHRGEDD